MAEENTGRKKNKFKPQFKIAVAAAVFVILIIISLFIRIDKVTVVGNEHFSSEEIEAAVFESGLDRSPTVALFREWFTSYGDPVGLEEVSVSLNGLTSATITVKEEAFMGYVVRDGRKFCFNSDGLIIQDTMAQVSGIPAIAGLDPEDPAVGSLLNTSDSFNLKTLLTITGYFHKSRLTYDGAEQSMLDMTDRIEIDSKGNFNCHLGDITVSLGSGLDISEKLQELSDILPKLLGRSGTLHLENYDGSTQNHVYLFQ